MIYLILFTWSEASARGKNFQWQDWVAYSLSVLKCLEPNKRPLRGKNGKSVAKMLMANQRQIIEAAEVALKNAFRFLKNASGAI